MVTAIMAHVVIKLHLSRVIAMATIIVMVKVVIRMFVVHHLYHPLILHRSNVVVALDLRRRDRACGLAERATTTRNSRCVHPVIRVVAVRCYCHVNTQLHHMHTTMAAMDL